MEKNLTLKVESMKGKRFVASGPFARERSDQIAEPLKLSDDIIEVYGVEFLEDSEDDRLNPYIHVIVKGADVGREYHSGIYLRHLEKLEPVQED